MLFTSFSFIVLVVVSLFLYYLPYLRNYQKVLLIISSFIFYAFHQPWLILLLILSIGINVITSYLTYYGSSTHRKFYAASGVVANVLILLFFKYSPLLGKTFFYNAPTYFTEFLVTIPLPVGISFYTFQGISLLIDTYSTKKTTEHTNAVDMSFIHHAQNVTLFVSFFPQLVAGPIVKAHEFFPQIHVKYWHNINWQLCFKHLVTGYFLKMVIADNLKDHTFWIEYPFFQSQSTVTLLILLFGYSMQIFADFAGYSLIALGVAEMFGFRLLENFNYPYISQSFSEFWSRWHISLSSFLKEYVYIPLGGNRKGKARTYLNLMLVMFLGGLWHGAAWSFAVWGVFHGVALVMERVLAHKINLPDSVFIRISKIIFVFSMVSLAWLLFKLQEFSYAVQYIVAIFTNTHIPINISGVATISYILLYSLAVIFYHLLYLYRQKEKSFTTTRMEYVSYGTMMLLILINSGSGKEFIYFQF